MSIKLILFIFIGFLSTYVGEIKSEEKVCKYSDPTTFVNCKKNEKSKIAPEYPLNTQIPNWRIFNYIPMWTGNSPILNDGYVGNTYEIVIGDAVTSIGSNYFTFGKGSGNDRVYNQFTSNASLHLTFFFNQLEHRFEYFPLLEK